MPEANYEERVKKIIASTLNISEDKIKMDAKIIEDLSADSLDVIELIMNLEEEFGIKIQDEESELITTVGQAVEHLQLVVMVHGHTGAAHCCGQEQPVSQHLGCRQVDQIPVVGARGIVNV